MVWFIFNCATVIGILGHKPYYIWVSIHDILGSYFNLQVVGIVYVRGGLQLRSPSLLGVVAGVTLGTGPVLSSGLRLRKSCRTQRGFTEKGFTENGLTVSGVSGRRLYVTFDLRRRTGRRRRRGDGLGCESWRAWHGRGQSKYNIEVWRWRGVSTELYFSGNTPGANSWSGRGAPVGVASGSGTSGLRSLDVRASGVERDDTYTVWVALLSFTTWHLAARRKPCFFFCFLSSSSSWSNNGSRSSFFFVL